MSKSPVLNLTALASSLHEATSADGRPVSADRTLELLKLIAQNSEVKDPLYAGAEGDLYGPLSLIFPIYLNLASLLGGELGIAAGKGGSGAWCFPGMPRLTTQFDALRETAAAAIQTLDADALKRFGYRVTDVFRRVVATGEDQHQANARVYAEKVGLHPAGEPPRHGDLQGKSSAPLENAATAGSATAIDLSDATRILQVDLARDGFKIESDHLLLLFIAEVQVLNVMHLVATMPGGVVYCDLSLLYLADAGWRRSIANHLEIPVRESSADLADAKAATGTLDFLKGLGLARVEAMDVEHAKKRGFGLLAPVFESARTGESLEQVLARLHHQHQGLRPVK